MRDHIGQEVTICGWVDTYRDHGGTLFIDLRDRYGKTQIVLAPEGEAANLRRDAGCGAKTWCRSPGRSRLEPAGTENPDLATGQIEVRVRRVEVLNKSKVPPMKPSAKEQPSEDLRLKYRFLDLRRSEMQRTLILRHRMAKLIRDYFDELGFIDIETLMLGRSTPEGARDYLVPSRVQPGSFYALPQSPQLFKQLLMVGGMERYYQIARCYRDEDFRADRQPEFTQLDLEMAFVDANDVIGVIDGLMARLAKELLGIELSLPLPRMTYDEAMERFGHDAPDLRFGMELVDVSDLAATTDFRVFRETVASGGKVRGLNAKNAADRYSRKGIDELTSYVTGDFGAKGLAWFKVGDERRLASPIAKNFSDETLAKIAERMQAEPGDLLLLVADKWEVTCKALNGLRRRLGAELRLYPPERMHFSWVVEFLMFEYDKEEACWAAMHHPFTSPRPQDRELLATEPAKCRAGLRPGDQRLRSRRRNDPNPRSEAAKPGLHRLLGIDEETAATRFGFLLDALQYGAAPRRHRPRAGPAGHALRRVGQYPRLHRISEDPTGDRHDDRRRAKVDGKQLRELGVKIIRE